MTSIFVLFLSFNIEKTKHVIENLTTDITLISKVLIDNPKQKVNICFCTRQAVQVQEDTTTRLMRLTVHQRIG